jgi:HD-GYP domain-containing protein (c-di-GMP phosphodiesterase class II)
MDTLSQVISKALDIVEGELLGVSTHHGLRVAILSAMMGRRFGLNEDALSALTTCALFHDSALTEYMLSMRDGEDKELHFRLHCECGQRNIEWLPFKTDVGGFVLYHHECADGSGLFGKKEGEYPLEAEIIMAADSLDAEHNLSAFPLERLPELRENINETAGKCPTKRAAKALLDVLDEKTLLLLRDDRVYETAKKVLPIWTVGSKDQSIIRVSGMVARVIDYKSSFTKKHTIQIANRSWIMSGYYDYSESLRARLYLAAALHDIGKIVTPAEILEKPGQLTSDEFNIIKLHVKYTHDWLNGIDGLEDVCDWASNHHEKLDGRGYPFGKKADELDFNSRLMVCVDMYQAISEERPYHPRRSHAETMRILYNESQRGTIDENIVKELDIVMAEYSDRDVPSPAVLRNFAK